MKFFYKSIGLLILFAFFQNNLQAENIIVNSQQSFDDALALVQKNDTISWESGTYEDIYMNIDKSYLVIRAEDSGNTKFTAASRVFISGSYVILTGFQFINGDIGSNDVIKTTGSYNHFTHLNIKDYTSYKYLVIRESCQFNKIAFCNFENRINLDDKNILSILVDKNTPGYHVIQYCSFKNFNGTGGDMGIEPIRIGLSSQGEFISRTIVEYCYFSECNGDGEIISNKARQNVFRYNTFENNPKAELVLRHGDEAVVYSNFFLNGMGGIRIKEGQHHVIYNNYFSGLTSRSMILMNYGVDPLDSIIIAYNMFVDSEEIILGGTGSYTPQNVVLANNIFANPKSELFADASNVEEWIGNIYFGSLGINQNEGIKNIDPQLELNAKGFYELGVQSPAIDSAIEGYPGLPIYPGYDIDTDILLDLMKNERPAHIVLKDVGCLEYPMLNPVSLYVNQSNTGPVYLWDSNAFKLKTTIEGTGNIIVNPPSDCFYPGMKIILEAIPGEDYSFFEWGGDINGSKNPYEILMDEDKNAIAMFHLDTGTDNDKDYSNPISMIIYPNPATKNIIVDLLIAEEKKVQLSLHDQNGKEIKTLINRIIQAGSLSESHDISDLSPGIYYFKLFPHNNNSRIQESCMIKI